MKTKNTSELNIFMTGANGGLGFETALQLVDAKVNSLTLGARTTVKSEGAKKRLLTKYPKVSTELITSGGYDMTNPKAIKNAVSKLPKEVIYDVIFLQSGGVFFTDDYQYTQFNGMRWEATVFQNAIGGLITYYALKERGLVAQDARIVFAGGEGARGIPGMIEKPIFNNIAALESYLFGKTNVPKYNPMNAIGVSKLLSAFMVMKLAETAKKETFVWFSPGLTGGTNGLKDNPPLKRFMMEKVAFPIAKLFGFSQSPQQGAAKYVDALFGKYGGNGDVLASPDGKTLGPIVDQKPMNVMFNKPEVINQFWQIIQDNFSSLPKAA